MQEVIQLNILKGGHCHTFRLSRPGQLPLTNVTHTHARTHAHAHTHLFGHWLNVELLVFSHRPQGAPTHPGHKEPAQEEEHC